jgi:hypothetical protein
MSFRYFLDHPNVENCQPVESASVDDRIHPQEGGGNVLRIVKILSYTLTWKALHLDFQVAAKYHEVLYLGMVVI